MSSVLHSGPRPTGKDSVYARDVVRILCKVLEESSRVGVGRKLIARRLGVEPRLVDVWCALSHPAAITSADLLALLSSDDVLPDEARGLLMRELANMGGFVVREDVEADEQAPSLQIVEICSALGEVSRRLSESRGAASEGGAGIAAGEARDMIAALVELTKQAEELKAALANTARRK